MSTGISHQCPTIFTVPICTFDFVMIIIYECRFDVFFDWFLEMGAHIMSDHLFHAFGNKYRGTCSFRTNSVWHVGIYIFNDCLVTR